MESIGARNCANRGLEVGEADEGECEGGLPHFCSDEFEIAQFNLRDALVTDSTYGFPSPLVLGCMVPCPCSKLRSRDFELSIDFQMLI